MKKILAAIFVVTLFFPALNAQENLDSFDEFEQFGAVDELSAFESAPQAPPPMLTSGCGEECDYDMPTTPPVQKWWEIPSEVTGLDYDRDTLLDGPVSIPPYAFAGEDGNGPGAAAGDMVASDDGTTEDIVKAGAKDYMDIQQRCNVCENDVLLAGLETPTAPAPKQSCEFTDTNGDCVFGSAGDGGTSQ